MAIATQRYEAMNNENNKWLTNQLPDEIVLSSILSCLSIKQLAKTRLVTRHWNLSYHHIYVLNFENLSAKQKINSKEWVKFKTEERLIEHETWNFVNWVNHVLAEHVGLIIDQFKVTFDVKNDYQVDVDKWLVFAFNKQVKKLELDLSTVSLFYQVGSEENRYVMDKPVIDKCLGVKPILTCLCLKSVNVTSQALEQLLVGCCATLENLCIEKSLHLTSIKACGTSLISLKNIKVIRCQNLETIDISAPKLLSFTYESGRLTTLGLSLLRIANASSLLQVSIEESTEGRLGNALASLSNYFSQFEYLKLYWPLRPGCNMEIKSCPVLANLKHLELWVYGAGARTLAGWIPFIEACPLLQKLKLKLRCEKRGLWKNVVKRDKHPLLCLKTLEIIDFIGCNVDLDVANFVLENGVALQEVIFQRSKDFKESLAALDLNIPRGVKLIFI